MKKSIVVLLMAVSTAFGQAVNLGAGPPAGVTNSSATVVGNGGPATLCYWIYADYPVGTVAPSPGPNTPACVQNGPNVLTAANKVRINWAPVAGATTYAVLKTTTPAPPQNGCACALITGTSATTVDDTGGALSAYTFGATGVAQGILAVNNRDFSSPLFYFAPYFLLIPGLQFPDGTQQTTAAVGGGAPINATYITKTPNGTLTNEQALSLLPTGIMKSTTVTGAVSNAASSDVVGLFTGCSGTQYLGADGACHVSNSSTNSFDCSAGISAGIYANLKACVDALVTAGGGVATVYTPGTYPIPVSIKLGSATALGDATNTRVTLRGANDVILDCTMTNNTDCLRLADGASIQGYPKSSTVSSSGVGFRIIAHNSAGTKIGWLIAPMLKDGSIESNSVDGVQLVGNTTATILGGLLDIKGVFASSVYRNITTANPGNSNSVQIHNASNQALTLSGNVTGSGTIATVTTAASTTNERDGHHTWVDGLVNVTTCTDASFNGTNMKVLSIISNTQFTYQAAGALGASSTACTVRPVTVSQITSVVLMDNNYINCNANAGCKPLVINSYGTGDVGAITIHHSAFEGTSTGNADATVSRDNDGSGATMENIAFTGTTHVEPDNADTTTCSGILVTGPVNGLTIDSIDGSGANATNSCAIIRLSDATPTGVKVLGTIKNLGWFYTVNAPNEVYRDPVLTGYNFLGAIASPPGGDVCGNPSMFCLYDYFAHGGTASGSIGITGMVSQAVGGGTLTATAAANGKGLTFTTNAAAGQGGNLGYLAGTAGQATYLGLTTPWIAEWGFSLNQTTDTTFWAGLGIAAANPPTNGVGCRFDTKAGVADTNFQFVSWSGGAATTDDTGVPPVAATNYRCTIQGTGTSGKVTFTLRNANTGAIIFGPRTFCPAGCDKAATLATASSLALSSGMLSATGGGGAAKAYIAWYARIMNWGLTQ